MGAFAQLGTFLKRHRWAIAWTCAAAAFIGLLWWLRSFPRAADPMLYSYVEIVGSLIAFTYAANMLVRFRGTHDRMSLILALAFALSGLIEVSSGLAFYNGPGSEPEMFVRVPLPWMVSRTLLAVLLVAALVVEKRLPNSRNPSREITGAFLAVAAVAYLTSAAYMRTLAESSINADALVPRPWQLLPAGFFLAATIGYWKRLKGTAHACDRAIFVAAALNTVCHLMASQAVSLLSAPFAAAQALKVCSYAVVLGGALLDNARLFDQVCLLAVSDPLTALANYRRFVDMLEAEIRRSDRTGRTFALVLLDLDGLKKINDKLGHLVGTRAILRVAEVLKQQSRAIDTAARYGGDEFALVLPETGSDAARRVAGRVLERLVADGEEPPLTASLGVAVYPHDGDSVDKLLHAADVELYRMKGRRNKKPRLPRVAACF